MGYHVVASGFVLSPFDGVFEHGYRGVVVFFVLSGYLVGRPFLVGEVAIPGYLLRRAARILPAYLIALVGITLLTGNRLFLDHPVAYLTLTQNLDPRLLATGVLAPAWTLHLEAWFYLLLPLLMAALLFAGRSFPGRAVVVIWAMSAVSMTAHVATSIGSDPGSARVGTLSLPAMLWAFLPGVCVAWLEVRMPAATAGLRRAWVTALGAGLATIGWFGSLTSPFGLALQDLALAGGVAVAILARRSRPQPSWQPPRRRRLATVLAPITAGLAWFGRVVSYPFYLWHVPVLGLVVGWHLAAWPVFGLTLLMTTLIGVLSWRLVEAPAMHAATKAAAAMDGRRSRHLHRARSSVQGALDDGWVSHGVPHPKR